MLYSEPGQSFGAITPRELQISHLLRQSHREIELRLSLLRPILLTCRDGDFQRGGQGVGQAHLCRMQERARSFNCFSKLLLSHSNGEQWPERWPFYRVVH